MNRVLLHQNVRYVCRIVAIAVVVLLAFLFIRALFLQSIPVVRVTDFFDEKKQVAAVLAAPIETLLPAIREKAARGLLALDIDAIASTIRGIGAVRQVRIRRVLTQGTVTLHIAVQARTPRFVFNDTQLIDDEGVVYTASQTTDGLPRIYGDNDKRTVLINAYEYFAPHVRAFGKVLPAVRVDTVGQMTLFLSDGKQIVLSAADGQAQFERAMLVMKTLPESRVPVVLDARYTNGVAVSPITTHIAL